MSIKEKMIALIFGVAAMTIIPGCSADAATESDEAAPTTQESLAASGEVGTQAEGWIRLWTDVDFGGGFEGGNLLGCVNAGTNDVASSVQVRGRFRLYDNGNCQGAFLEVSGDVSNLHAHGWGDRISSYQPI